MGQNKIILHFITSNSHKFLEAKTLINQHAREKIEIKHLKMKYPELQGDNLEEIAASSLGMVLTTIKTSPNEAYFIEDAGLFIESLKGFPGPYSSYVFSTIGWEGILKILNNNPHRSAYFKSVVALYYNQQIKIFTAVSRGEITTHGKGTQGFGFDPIFKPTNIDKTFAEMDSKEKNEYSHRSKAIQKMINWLLTA